MLELILFQSFLGPSSLFIYICIYGVIMYSRVWKNVVLTVIIVTYCTCHCNSVYGTVQYFVTHTHTHNHTSCVFNPGHWSLVFVRLLVCFCLFEVCKESRNTDLCDRKKTGWAMLYEIYLYICSFILFSFTFAPYVFIEHRVVREDCIGN